MNFQDAAGAEPAFPAVAEPAPEQSAAAMTPSEPAPAWDHFPGPPPQAAFEPAAKGQAELARDIPGWSPQMAQALGEFAARTFGFTAEELDSVTDPRLVKLLHQAWCGAEREAVAARLRAAQATAPAYSLGRGRGAPDITPDTDDFAAFERMAEARLKRR